MTTVRITRNTDAILAVANSGVVDRLRVLNPQQGWVAADVTCAARIVRLHAMSTAGEWTAAASIYGVVEG